MFSPLVLNCVRYSDQRTVNSLFTSGVAPLSTTCAIANMFLTYIRSVVRFTLLPELYGISNHNWLLLSIMDLKPSNSRYYFVKYKSNFIEVNL